ncbi:MAG: ABC transporter, partial [Mycobacterium sp.]|nr:ABC transporter [Mycobacterium sp.]
MTGISDRRLKILAFAVSFAVYTGLGYWLQVRHGFILGDSLSRVYAAQSVVYSRDPHLAAIGFIFTPLTAMVEIPFIALSPVFPPLAG